MELTLEQLNAYATQGRRDSWPALDEQCIYTHNLLLAYLTELLAAGLPITMAAAMIEKQKAAAAIFGSRREAQVDSQLATGGETVAMTDAKSYIYKMSQVLPIATRGVDLDDLKPEHLIPPKQQTKSVAKTKARLDAMRPLVVRLEEKLKPYFGGQSALTTHDKVTAEIQEAQGQQTTKQEARSPETFKLNAAKGQLLEMIEDVNRLGRVAFMGQAEVVGKFNKDVLLRARRGKRRQTAASESDGKATTTTTPASPA